MIEVRRETNGAEPFVLRLRDATRPEALDRCIALLARIGHHTVLVDLAARETLAADYLAVLRRSGRYLRELGGELAVVCRTDSLRRLLDVTLLAQSFSVYPSRSAARSAFAAKEHSVLGRGH